MTHPFRLKILLVYYFHSTFSAGGSLEGQFDFTTHSSETHTHTHTHTHTVFSGIIRSVESAGSDITAVRTCQTHVPIRRVSTYFS